MFSMCHIKAVLLVGAPFCLVSHRATFNDALENHTELEALTSETAVAQ